MNYNSYTQLIWNPNFSNDEKLTYVKANDIIIERNKIKYDVEKISANDVLNYEKEILWKKCFTIEDLKNRNITRVDPNDYHFNLLKYTKEEIIEKAKWNLIWEYKKYKNEEFREKFFIWGKDDPTLWYNYFYENGIIKYSYEITVTDYSEDWFRKDYTYKELIIKDYPDQEYALAIYNKLSAEYLKELENDLIVEAEKISNNNKNEFDIWKNSKIEELNSQYYYWENEASIRYIRSWEWRKISDLLNSFSLFNIKKKEIFQEEIPSNFIKKWSPSEEQKYLPKDELEDLEAEEIDKVLEFIGINYDDLIEKSNIYYYNSGKINIELKYSDWVWFELSWTAPLDSTTMAFWRSWLILVD